MKSFPDFKKKYKESPYTENFFRAVAAIRNCSMEKMFLNISENSQENTSVMVSLLIKL